MFRVVVAGLVFFGSAACAVAQEPSLERILAGPERSDLRWNVSISPPVLLSYQRIAVRIALRVDGKEIVERAGHGGLVLAAEIRDGDGKPYRTRQIVDLGDFKNATSKHELETVLHAFLLPGEYRISLAAVGLNTKKVSVAHRTLRVSPLNNDPLPAAWRDLPPVEFVNFGDVQDRWYLPGDRRRLSLSVKNPVSMRILVNVSPSTQRQRQRRAFNASMGAMIPSLKVLSQVDLAGASHEVAVVDVLRRRVSYDRAEMDWPALKQALNDANPNMIDAAALKDRDQDAQFFATEASRIATAPAEGRSVLIVMSAPLVFNSRQELRPIESEHFSRVFFLRFQPAPLWALARGPELPAMPADELEHALKPLQPRTFEIFSAVDFRKALGAILKEIEQ